MKYLLVTMAILFSHLTYSGTPELTEVKLQNIYTASGFSSDENAEVTITGWLPNICHKEPIVTLKRDLLRKVIYLNVVSYAYHSSSPFCPQNIIPFVKTVDLGRLDTGSYLIIVNEDSPFELMSRIYIQRPQDPQSKQNKYLYVTDVKNKNHTLTLTGYKPSSCYEVSDVEFINDRYNTYTVLPILNKTTDFCPMKMTPEEVEVEIPHHLTTQRVMLHIRSFGGELYKYCD